MCLVVGQGVESMQSPPFAVLNGVHSCVHPFPFQIQVQTVLKGLAARWISQRAQLLLSILHISDCDSDCAPWCAVERCTHYWYSVSKAHCFQAGACLLNCIMCAWLSSSIRALDSLSPLFRHLQCLHNPHLFLLTSTLYNWFLHPLKITLWPFYKYPQDHICAWSHNVVCRIGGPVTTCDFNIFTFLGPHFCQSLEGLTITPRPWAGWDGQK